MILQAGGGPLVITQVLKQAGLTPSTSEALRMIEQGGVRLDGERVSDKGLKLAPGTHRRGAGREAQVRPRDARVAFKRVLRSRDESR